MAALWGSIASLVVATILNIAPMHEKAEYHSSMYRRWSDLRRDVDMLIAETSGEDEGAVSDEYLSRRYRDLVSKKNIISAEETAPDMALVEKCWGDENESRTGFRTTDPEEKPRYSGEQAAL